MVNKDVYNCRCAEVTLASSRGQNEAHAVDPDRDARLSGY